VRCWTRWTAKIECYQQTRLIEASTDKSQAIVVTATRLSTPLSKPLSTAVKRHQTITQESFDELLRWLDGDRERAAMKYENIRDSLRKIFTWRRCVGPEDLADETMNIVTTKVADLAHEYKGDPALYFYGVARRLVLDEHKAKPTAVSFDDLDFDIRSLPADTDNELEELYQDFEYCLYRLSEQHRELLLKYYTPDHDKVAYRIKLAEQLGIKPTALRKRVQRLKVVLRGCLEQKLTMRRSMNGNL